MDILIAGGSGFIGQALIKYLLDCNVTKEPGEHYKVTILGRNKYKLAKLLEKLEDSYPEQQECLNFVSWRELEHDQNNLVDMLAKFDCVINLAGLSIGEKRWSTKYKQEVINSRVTTTAKLANGCLLANQKYNKSLVLYNASAIGTYGLDNPDEIYTENSQVPKEPKDFLATVGAAWEQAAQPAIDQGLRVVFMRFAVVLDWHGGALKQMLLPFKLGLGGRIGSGHQSFSWISLDDLVSIIETLINKEMLVGPVNLVAPEITSQEKFAKALAKSLRRPCIIPLPSFIVKLLFGQMGDELLLKGQKIKSNLLSELYSEWKHPDLKSFFASSRSGHQAVSDTTM